MAIEQSLVQLTCDFALSCFLWARFSNLVRLFRGLHLTRTKLFQFLKFNGSSLECPNISAHTFDTGYFSISRFRFSLRNMVRAFCQAAAASALLVLGCSLITTLGIPRSMIASVCFIHDFTHDVHSASSFQVGKGNRGPRSTRNFAGNYLDCCITKVWRQSILEVSTGSDSSILWFEGACAFWGLRIQVTDAQDRK